MFVGIGNKLTISGYPPVIKRGKLEHPPFIKDYKTGWWFGTMEFL